MREGIDEIVPPSPGDALVAELRRDVVSGNHVLVAPSRSARPYTVSRDHRPVSLLRTKKSVDVDCPFCPGNEHATAEELVRVGGDGSAADWRVRVVRNRYPVVGATEGATGQCEVIVFQSHVDRLEDLDVHEVAEILTVIRDRVAAQAAERASVQVFVNAEADAGASIAHPHAQIIGLDFVPPALDLEFDMIAALGTDPLQRDLDLADERDLVVVDGPTVAWCPWAMSLPYSVRIAQRKPTSAFIDLSASDVAAAAQALRDVLRSINDVLEHPAYNVVIFSDQSRGDLERRWRIEVVPRITVGGGFEIGTAVTTHSTEPAAAAQSLRRQLATYDAAPTLDRGRLRAHS